MKRLKEFGEEPQEALQALSKLWDLLPEFESPLGRMARKVVAEGVPPDNKT